MDGIGGILILVVLIVLVANAGFLFFRLRKTPLRKSSRKHRAPDEEEDAIRREKQIHLWLEQEEEDAKRRVELRNKTLELYDEVRRRAASAETPSSQESDT